MTDKLVEEVAELNLHYLGLCKKRDDYTPAMVEPELTNQIISMVKTNLAVELPDSLRKYISDIVCAEINCNECEFYDICSPDNCMEGNIAARKILESIKQSLKVKTVQEVEQETAKKIFEWADEPCEIHTGFTHFECAHCWNELKSNI